MEDREIIGFNSKILDPPPMSSYYSQNMTAMNGLLTASTVLGRKRETLLALRLGTLIMVVVLLTLHIRSVRVFKWEQSVSGGLLCTYCVISSGLAMTAGAEIRGSRALEVYFSGFGAALFALNAIMLWQLWHNAGELTLVVVELLLSLGVRLKRQVMCKVFLSFLVSVVLVLDVVFAPMLTPTPSANKINE